MVNSHSNTEDRSARITRVRYQNPSCHKDLNMVWKGHLLTRVHNNVQDKVHRDPKGTIGSMGKTQVFLKSPDTNKNGTSKDKVMQGLIKILLEHVAWDSWSTQPKRGRLQEGKVSLHLHYVLRVLLQERLGCDDSIQSFEIL